MTCGLRDCHVTPCDLEGHSCLGWYGNSEQGFGMVWIATGVGVICLSVVCRRREVENRTVFERSFTSKMVSQQLG